MYTPPDIRHQTQIALSESYHSGWWRSKGGARTHQPLSTVHWHQVKVWGQCSHGRRHERDEDWSAYTVCPIGLSTIQAASTPLLVVGYCSPPWYVLRASWLVSLLCSFSHHLGSRPMSRSFLFVITFITRHGVFHFDRKITTSPAQKVRFREEGVARSGLLPWA